MATPYRRLQQCCQAEFGARVGDRATIRAHDDADTQAADPALLVGGDEGSRSWQRWLFVALAFRLALMGCVCVPCCIVAITFRLALRRRVCRAVLRGPLYVHAASLPF